MNLDKIFHLSSQRQLWQRSSVRYVWQSLQTIRLHWRREWD